MAGTLIPEAIVVPLALPVVSSVGGGLSAWSTAYLVGFAVLLVLLAGVQGRLGHLGEPWRATDPDRRFPGLSRRSDSPVLFAVVWLLIAYLRGEVLRRQRRGLLPGQQPPPD